MLGCSPLQTSGKTAAAPAEHAPLQSFNAFTDYVFDARWSPVHPAMFAAVDGQGILSLWNLNIDMEVRSRVVARPQPDVGGLTTGRAMRRHAQGPIRTIPVSEGRALNRVRWDSDGRRLAVGGADGAVYVFDIGEVRAPHRAPVHCPMHRADVVRVCARTPWCEQLGQPRMEEWLQLERNLADLAGWKPAPTAA